MTIKEKLSAQGRAEKRFKRRKRSRVYDPTKYNFNKPNLDTFEGAAFLGCSPYTLRLSRTTGTLFGVEAPPFKRRGRNVWYQVDSLKEWDSQFHEQTNTAQGVA